jgi:hypothetical protein
LKLILLILTGAKQRRITALIFSAQRVLSVLTSHGNMCSIWTLCDFFYSAAMLGWGLQENNEEEVAKVWGFLRSGTPRFRRKLQWLSPANKYLSEQNQGVEKGTNRFLFGSRSFAI